MILKENYKMQLKKLIVWNLKKLILKIKQLLIDNHLQDIIQEKLRLKKLLFKLIQLK